MSTTKTRKARNFPPKNKNFNQKNIKCPKNTKKNKNSTKKPKIFPQKLHEKNK